MCLTIRAFPHAEARRIAANIAKAAGAASAHDVSEILARSEREDDLAEMCVGAHVREGGVGFLERIGFVDRQAKAAGFNRWQQIGAHAAVDLADFFRAAGTEGDADVIDAFHRMQVEIELALHAAEAADIDDTAAHAGRLHVGVRDIAGNLPQPTRANANRARDRRRTPSAARAAPHWLRCR